MANVSNNDIARAIFLFLKDKKNDQDKETFSKIVKFLVRKRLISKSSDIFKRLDKIINQENGKLLVKLSSARKLDEKNKINLKNSLKERYKVEEIILKEIEDEKLLGGIRVEIEDEIIDLTIKNKLKKLQEHLIRKT